MKVVEELRTLYKSFGVALGELTDTRSEKEKALDLYRDTLSRYHNSEWPHEDDVADQLEYIELPYNLSSEGLPETEEDLRKAQEYIFDEPVEAALYTHVVNRALENEVDITELLDN